jgi:hypothetical protein
VDNNDATAIPATMPTPVLTARLIISGLPAERDEHLY